MEPAGDSSLIFSTFAFLADLLAFIVGLLLMAMLLAGWLSLARRKDWTVRDRYKQGEPAVAGMGGVPVILGWLIVLFFMVIFLRYYIVNCDFCTMRSKVYPQNFYKFLIVLSLILVTAILCAIMGWIDDMYGVSQRWKAFLPLLFGIPLAFFISNESSFWPDFFSGFPSLFIALFILLYVSIGTNLTNMHAGFNGLAAGNAFIMLLALIVAVKINMGLLMASLAGPTAALLLFNRYPARVLEGNVGSHLWGGAIAAALLLEGLWLEGLVLFAPQLVDFGLWGYARLRRYPFQKYAPLVDGRIRPDDPFKLKFLVARWFPREWQAVLVLWGLQALAAAAFVALVMA